ncbi:MAG: putative metal-binding motif-containing protein [Alphaproteobacteria bacterium]|nr:putative metal-binding motif-containing protein [Alphaproteobacteria bacterium]
MRALVIASLALLGSCSSEEHLVSDRLADLDGDGVPDAFDCDPTDPTVAGDLDCDGWWDERCLGEDAGGPPFLLLGELGGFWDGYCAERAAPELGTYAAHVEAWHYGDCNDAPARDGALVHPLGHPNTDVGAELDDLGNPLPWELSLQDQEGLDQGELQLDESSCSWRDLISSEKGVFARHELLPPAWASDGIDNDCDGEVDVPDYDGDGFAGVGGDCNDCYEDIHPDVNEAETTSYGACTCALRAYDGFDDDCSEGPLVDVDSDGQAASGWGDCEAVCGAIVNELTGRTARELVDELVDAIDDPAQPWFEPVRDTPVSDCDDGRIGVHVGAAELCDERDQDCDGDGYDGFERRGNLRVLVVDEATGADALCDPVATVCDDAANGTEEAPYARVGDALAQMAVDPVCRVITVEPGTYAESLVVDAPFGGAPGPFTLEGRAAGVVLQGDGDRFLRVSQEADDSVVVTGVTFEGGVGREGGLWIEGGAATLSDLTFDDIDAVDGGALVAYLEGPLDLSSSVFSGNVGGLGAGGLTVSADGPITLTDVVLEDNEGDAGGGANLTAPSVTMTGGGAWVNHSTSDGGGLRVSANEVYLTGLTLDENWAAGSGGGFHLIGDTTLDGLIVSTNHALGGDGGGGYVFGPGLRAIRVGFSGNTAVGSGGGLSCNTPSATIGDGTSFRLNGAGVDGGGAMIVGGSANVVAAFQDNVSGASGGGLRVVVNSDLTVGGSWENNTAQFDGGGASLLAGTSVDLSGSFRLNYATRGGGGGATVTGDTVNIASVVGSANHAGQDGGLFQVIGTSSVVMEGIDTNEEGNTAVGAGGVLDLAGSTITARDLVLTDSVAGTSGGAMAITLLPTTSGASVVSIEGLEARRNHADAGSGGALVVQGGGELRLCESAVCPLANNSASEGGGAVSATMGTIENVTGGSVRLGALDLQANHAGARGGALDLVAAKVQTTDGQLVQLTENDAPTGGGGYVVTTELTSVKGLVARGNHATTGDGGALYLVSDQRAGAPTSEVDIAGGTGDPIDANTSNNGRGGTLAATFTGNLAVSTKVDCGDGPAVARDGGGIAVAGSGQLTMTGVVVQGCRVTGDGGGAYLGPLETLVEMDGVGFLHNEADGRGGGLLADVLDVCPTGGCELYLHDNGATDGGGAFILADTLLLERLLATGNRASTGDGGGAYVAVQASDAPQHIRLAELNGNDAGARGGGMFLTGGGSIRIDEMAGGVGVLPVDTQQPLLDQLGQLPSEPDHAAGAGGVVFASGLAELGLGVSSLLGPGRGSFALPARGGAVAATYVNQMELFGVRPGAFIRSFGAGAEGGALYLDHTDLTKDQGLHQISFEGNGAPGGGAIFASVSSLVIEQSRFLDNRAAPVEIPVPSTCTLSASSWWQAGALHMASGDNLSIQFSEFEDTLGSAVVVESAGLVDLHHVVFNGTRDPDFGQLNGAAAEDANRLECNFQDLGAVVALDAVSNERIHHVTFYDSQANYAIFSNATDARVAGNVVAEMHDTDTPNPAGEVSMAYLANLGGHRVYCNLFDASSQWKWGDGDCGATQGEGGSWQCLDGWARCNWETASYSSTNMWCPNGGGCTSGNGVPSDCQGVNGIVDVFPDADLGPPYDDDLWFDRDQVFGLPNHNWDAFNVRERQGEQFSCKAWRHGIENLGDVIDPGAYGDGASGWSNYPW